MIQVILIIAVIFFLTGLECFFRWPKATFFSCFSFVMLLGCLSCSSSPKYDPYVHTKKRRVSKHHHTTRAAPTQDMEVEVYRRKLKRKRYREAQEAKALYYSRAAANFGAAADAFRSITPQRRQPAAQPQYMQPLPPIPQYQAPRVQMPGCVICN